MAGQNMGNGRPSFARTRTGGPARGSGATPGFMRDAIPATRSASTVQRGAAPRRSARASQYGAAARNGATRVRGQRETYAARPLRTVGVVMGLLAISGLLLLLVYVVLSNTSAFTIASIDAEATEHVSAEDIARLANVTEGTTLLNVNEEQVRESLHKNPWVGDVDIARVFPNRLRVTVTERRVEELVVMANDSVVWCLGSGDVWIEPFELSVGEGQTVDDAALVAASEMGALLVTAVPPSVSPQAGSVATDAVLRAVTSFKDQLSPEFMAQVVSMAASGEDSIACTLSNGVQVSLGAASAISTKEALVGQLLSKYPNRITYINVRVPSNPSYRLLDSESVVAGTGTLADADVTPSQDHGQGATDGDDEGDVDGASGSAT